MTASTDDGDLRLPGASAPITRANYEHAKQQTDALWASLWPERARLAALFEEANATDPPTTSGRPG